MKMSTKMRMRCYNNKHASLVVMVTRVKGKNTHENFSIFQGGKIRPFLLFYLQKGKLRFSSEGLLLCFWREKNNNEKPFFHFLRNFI